MTSWACCSVSGITSGSSYLRVLIFCVGGGREKRCRSAIVVSTGAEYIVSPLYSPILLPRPPTTVVTSTATTARVITADQSAAREVVRNNYIITRGAREASREGGREEAGKGGRQPESERRTSTDDTLSAPTRLFSMLYRCPGGWREK